MLKLIENCQLYPGSRWLLGRAKLKALKETTLNTFFELSSKLGISDQWTFNSQSNVITFDNGSEIILKDLFHYPKLLKHIIQGLIYMIRSFQKKQYWVLSTDIRQHGLQD